MTAQTPTVQTVYGSKNQKLQQRKNALKLLTKQLSNSTKPVKGKKPLKTDENGAIIHYT